MVSGTVEFLGCDGFKPATASDSNAAAAHPLTSATVRYTHLREYLEHYSLPCNNNVPLNPGGERRYLIIISHCHYGKRRLALMFGVPT